MFSLVVFVGYLYAALFLAEQEHALYYSDWPETLVIIRRQCDVNCKFTVHAKENFVYIILFISQLLNK